MPAATEDARHAGTAAETRLNDLQADVESGSRLITKIHHQGARIRDVLDRADSGQAECLQSLLNQVARLKACVMQQRATLRELRHDIRHLRDVVDPRSRR
ncbi:MAG TPA: hypothetical protein VIW45_08910 [Vicinamibacterales bacterium]|jgi:predicted  nucleic acid-binding Zn-ribbon protein